MAKGMKPKSWAEQLADLEDPAPKGCYQRALSKPELRLAPEFDPEDNTEHQHDSSESADEDLEGARAHYVDVECA